MELNKANLDKLFELIQERLDPDKIITDNCTAYSYIINLVLSELGIKSSIVLGYAAWRTGKKAHDTIANFPECVTFTGAADGINIHSWIEIESNILDFTTYQLKQKAQNLDMADGFITNVKWCPNYLFTPKSNLLSLTKVTDSYKVGVYGYQKVQNLEAVDIYESKDVKQYLNFVDEIKNIMKDEYK